MRINFKAIDKYGAFVDEYGNVFYCDIRNLKLIKRNSVLNINGYKYITFKRGKKVKTISIHRLVCVLFNGPPPTKEHQCAHLDGNRLNNHYTNLKWCTSYENNFHKKAHGTNRGPRGEQSGNAKLTDYDATLIRRLYSEYAIPQKDLCEVFGVSSGTMSQLLRNKIWTHLLGDFK